MGERVEYRMKTVDFRPVSVDGWRAVSPKTGEVVPLAGWLIREERAYRPGTYNPVDPADARDRHVDAAIVVDGQVVSVHDTMWALGVWQVYAPGELLPGEVDGDG